MLQILDDGRITDSKGVTVDFKNTIIIMTSNLGSEFAFEQDQKKKEEEYDKIIKSYFKPEFVNRIDEIIIFNPLDQAVIGKIADKFLNILRGRLAQNDMELEVSDEARNKIIENGFDPLYGARPMKRHIQRTVESLLAKTIIANPDVKKFEVDVENEQYIIKPIR